MIGQIKKKLLRRKLDNAVDNAVRNIRESTFLEKECLCYMFLKETGLKASQCEIVTQHTQDGFKIWVQKKGESNG